MTLDAIRDTLILFQHHPSLALAQFGLLWISRKAPRVSVIATAIIGLPYWIRAARKVASVQAQAWMDKQTGSAADPFRHSRKVP
jgi:hypothetical protein